MIEAMASAPVVPLGPVVCAAHEEGQRSAFPMNEYLMDVPAMVCTSCQPQYTVQKPEVAVTSAEVSTK